MFNVLIIPKKKNKKKIIIIMRSKFIIFLTSLTNKMKESNQYCKFVCIEVLQPSQSNGVMLSTVSLPYHTLPGQA